MKQPVLKGRPSVVFTRAATEFTVHYDQHVNRFLEVQTEGFGAATVAVRSANRLEGPWSELKTIYRPPESNRLDALVYAGKAHPELLGADLILTYVANSTDFGVLVNDMTIYYPRFIRVRF
jgi:hypothetical protein